MMQSQKLGNRLLASIATSAKQKNTSNMDLEQVESGCSEEMAGRRSSLARLVIVCGQPFPAGINRHMLTRLVLDLMLWDCGAAKCDLNEELKLLAHTEPTKKVEPHGEETIFYSTPSLLVEIHKDISVQTLVDKLTTLRCKRDEYSFVLVILWGVVIRSPSGGCPSTRVHWPLQDGLFSPYNFTDFDRTKDSRWTALAISSNSNVAPNFPEKRTDKFDGLLSFSLGLLKFLEVPSSELPALPLSKGSRYFSLPTLYVFPSGPGSSAFFGVQEFTMLVDGGYSRQVSCWNFIKYLERLDVLLVTNHGLNNVLGTRALLARIAATIDAEAPKIGCAFVNHNTVNRSQPTNAAEDASVNYAMEGNVVCKDFECVKATDSHATEVFGSILNNDLLEEECVQSNTTINPVDEAKNLVQDLLQLKTLLLPCAASSKSPSHICLYHKVSVGRLCMDVLQPIHDGSQQQSGCISENKADEMPFSELGSVCAMLNWSPASQQEKTTRILFTGTASQDAVFEGLSKWKEGQKSGLQNHTVVGCAGGSVSNDVNQTTTEESENNETVHQKKLTSVSNKEANAKKCAKIWRMAKKKTNTNSSSTNLLDDAADVTSKPSNNIKTDAKGKTTDSPIPVIYLTKPTRTAELQEGNICTTAEGTNEGRKQRKTLVDVETQTCNDDDKQVAKKVHEEEKDSQKKVNAERVNVSTDSPNQNNISSKTVDGEKCETVEAQTDAHSKSAHDDLTEMKEPTNQSENLKASSHTENTTGLSLGEKNLTQQSEAKEFDHGDQPGWNLSQKSNNEDSLKEQEERRREENSGKTEYKDDKLNEDASIMQQAIEKESCCVQEKEINCQLETQTEVELGGPEENLRGQTTENKSRYDSCQFRAEELTPMSHPKEALEKSGEEGSADGEGENEVKNMHKEQKTLHVNLDRKEKDLGNTAQLDDERMLTGLVVTVENAMSSTVDDVSVESNDTKQTALTTDEPNVSLSELENDSGQPHATENYSIKPKSSNNMPVEDKALVDLRTHLDQADSLDDLCIMIEGTDELQRPQPQTSSPDVNKTFSFSNLFDHIGCDDLPVNPFLGMSNEGEPHVTSPEVGVLYEEINFVDNRDKEIDQDSLEDFDPQQEWGIPMNLPSPDNPRKDATAKNLDNSREETAVKMADRSSADLGAVDVSTNINNVTSTTNEQGLSPRSKTGGGNILKPSSVDQENTRSTADDTISKPTNQTIPITRFQKISIIGSKQKTNPDVPVAVKDSFKAYDRNSTNKQLMDDPVYVDVAFIPCGGDPRYVDEKFFMLTRSRYYVLSSNCNDLDILDRLLEAKESWSENLRVSVIPTYDTKALGDWKTTHVYDLGRLNIDVKPAAQSCEVTQWNDIEAFPAFHLVLGCDK